MPRAFREDPDQGTLLYCRPCDRWQPVLQFDRHAGGFRYMCKKCRAAKRAAVSQETRNYEIAYRQSVWGRAVIRRHALRKRFNLSPEEYDVMAAFQGYVCALCGEPETLVRFEAVARLSVDHDHMTKKVRGLLCHRCNTCLERIEKLGPEWAHRALAYLAKHKAA